MGSQPKLTRTQSSLLRSSPTVRSSIHSLSSISDPDSDDGEKKTRIRPGKNPTTRIAVATLTILTLLTTFFYLKTEEIATSENLLLTLIFIAVALFYLSNNRELLNRSKSVLRSLYYENRKTRSKPVQWFIGDESSSPKKKTVMIKEGVELYTNGDFYEGEFHKGKCNGSGVYNFFINGRYEGDWVDGKYDGFGIECWAKGSRYRGQYRGGFRHGFGVYRFYTGDSYAGEWVNGQYHGVGVQTCSDGSCYVGEFKRGVKHGLGCYHFRNGDRYGGEYFGDKIHGFGVYHFANSHCYEGSWHEGRKQGFGMYTFRSGEAKCGEWDSGSLKNPLPQLTDSVLRPVQVLILRIHLDCTIQAARKAAENAINLHRVDAQVNKAVMAANRAATAARVAAVKAVQNRMDGNFHDIQV